MNNYEDVISNKPLSKETIKWARKASNDLVAESFFNHF